MTLTPEQRRERGERAKRLLEDPLLIEAFQAVEMKAINDWLAATDVETREDCWRGARVVKGVRDHLASYLSDATLAEAQIEREKARRGKFNRL